MKDLEDQLAAAFADLAERAPHRPDLALHVHRRDRGRRRATIAGGAALLAAASVAGVIALDHRSTVSTVGASTCNSVIDHGVLPVWARTGFSEAEPKVPFVRSARGDMVAILFGGALHAAPANDPSNKVLWVSQGEQSGSSDLIIDARLEGTDITARRTLPGGPGPSTVDMPRAGCWRFTLHWGGRTDTIDMAYAPSAG